MKPILTIRDADPEYKVRTAVIIKSELHRDIDSLTYKYAEGRDWAQQRINAASSDTEEWMDGHIINRHIEFRDAKLRRFMAFAMADDVEVRKCDDIMPNDPRIIYKFWLPVGFKDALFQALTNYIHRYLVWGALFDWYGASLGDDQAALFRQELDELETSIVNLLRTPSYTKRPLQPFGPAKKIW